MLVEFGFPKLWFLFSVSKQMDAGKGKKLDALRHADLLTGIPPLGFYR